MKFRQWTTQIRQETADLAKKNFYDRIADLEDTIKKLPKFSDGTPILPESPVFILYSYEGSLRIAECRVLSINAKGIHEIHKPAKEDYVLLFDRDRQEFPTLELAIASRSRQRPEGNV